MNGVSSRRRRFWLPALVLIGMAAGFTAGYGQVVRARNATGITERILQSLWGSVGPEGSRQSGIESPAGSAATSSAGPSARPAASGSLAWPASGQLSSHFGSRWGRHHKGIDIANAIGTPIVAAADGTVAFAGWTDGGYGYLVEILHPDGVRTLYAHNSQLLVDTGDVVKRSQTIALMGDSGHSTGPHLHFEVVPPGSQAVNPLNRLSNPS
jgi:murein DD-endopeptidase MepM/ murein hydrolase activator NlpD